MNTIGTITIDHSHWPLLIVSFEGSPTLEQYRQFFAKRATYLQRGEKHVGITDTIRLKLPPPQFRQLQGDWVAQHDALLARTFLGTATVIQATEILLLKSAAAYRTPPPYPTVNVPDLISGVRWACERLDAASLTDAATRLRRDFGLNEEPLSTPT